MSRPSYAKSNPKLVAAIISMREVRGYTLMEIASHLQICIPTVAKYARCVGRKTAKQHFKM